MAFEVICYKNLLPFYYKAIGLTLSSVNHTLRTFQMASLYVALKIYLQNQYLNNTLIDWNKD